MSVASVIIAWPSMAWIMSGKGPMAVIRMLSINTAISWTLLSVCCMNFGKMLIKVLHGPIRLWCICRKWEIWPMPRKRRVKVNFVSCVPISILIWFSNLDVFLYWRKETFLKSRPTLNVLRWRMCMRLLLAICVRLMKCCLMWPCRRIVVVQPNGRRLICCRKFIWQGGALSKISADNNQPIWIVRLILPKRLSTPESSPWIRIIQWHSIRTDRRCFLKQSGVSSLQTMCCLTVRKETRCTCIGFRLTKNCRVCNATFSKGVLGNVCGRLLICKPSCSTTWMTPVCIRCSVGCSMRIKNLPSLSGKTNIIT